MRKFLAVACAGPFPIVVVLAVACAIAIPHVIAPARIAPASHAGYQA